MSRKSTDTFTYYNRNPKGLKSASDCVARAISTASGYSWQETVQSLTQHGIELSRVFNEKHTYDSWLQKEGWIKKPMPRKSDNTKYTVKEFQEINNKGIYIIGVANHLTMIEDGMLYDTWNCDYKTVGNYWTREV